jgi:RimJ/RimL family protein N-acetyltransferase
MPDAQDLPPDPEDLPSTLKRPTGPLRRPAAVLTDEVVMLDDLRDTDVDAIVTCCDDPEVARWLPLPSPYTATDARAFLASIQGLSEAGDSLAFAIRDAIDGAYLGTIGLHFARCRAGEAEIGYLVSPAVRGRGVARRAVRLLADWALRNYGCRRVELLVQPGNVASRRAAEGAAAAFEGTRRNGLALRSGTVTDAAVYALTSEDLSSRSLGFRHAAEHHCIRVRPRAQPPDRSRPMGACR